MTWLLPTRRRIPQLQRLLDAMVKTGLSTPGFILIEQTEYDELYHDYAALDLPEAWHLYTTSVEGYAAKIQEVWQDSLCKDAPWIGIIADDNMPVTPGWDTALVDRMKGWNIAAGNDMWQFPNRLHSAVVYSGDLLRAVGYFAPPDMRHLFIDDVWETLGKATGCIEWCADIVVRHDHASRTGRPDNTTRAARDFWDHDEKVFKDWQLSGKPAALTAIGNLMKACHAANAPPDLTGVSLLISTPCADGKYDRTYVKAFLNTVTLLRQLGAVVDWAEMPFCSDVSLARNKIAATFLRSPHTHMLMIDDDMGWNPVDVVRLLMAKREFIAAAGRKKCEQLIYCVNVTDDDNNPIAIHHEADTGIIEATAVGGAFVLVAKSCMERMVQSYPDLQFRGDNDGLTHALYDAFIVNGRRLSDDFAFCRRWKDIGGKIYVLPSVRLDHSGGGVWSGALEDALLTSVSTSSYSYEEDLARRGFTVVVGDPEKEAAE